MQEQQSSYNTNYHNTIKTITMQKELFELLNNEYWVTNYKKLKTEYEKNIFDSIKDKTNFQMFDDYKNKNNSDLHNIYSFLKTENKIIIILNNKK